MNKNRRDRRRAASRGAAPASAAASAPPKTMTVSMGGFDGLINALGRIPLLVNRALPHIEGGDLAAAESGLTDALLQVELAKAAILGNLALTTLKAGDIGKCVGYVAIAIDSLTELALDDTELCKMLKVVQASLPEDVPAETPGETPAAGATTGEGNPG